VLKLELLQNTVDEKKEYNKVILFDKAKCEKKAY
jgi:hypothetical protein